MEPLQLFWEILRASLLSSGGGNVPILHAELVGGGWVSERQFAEALAIGQISPGPTGLWVLCLGYLVDGTRGSLLALLGITLPPVLVLLVHRVYQRIGGRPATEGFVRGLALAVSGIFLVVLINLMRSVGITPVSVAIMLAALALGRVRQVPTIAIIGLAALAGALIYR